MTLEVEYRNMQRLRGDAYRPRTRHFDAQGQPVYTNRLFLQSSPYLLQHAHNPVDWHPWGDEAFDIARRLDRPVLLSVGYSTCHWCHVMEEESFEDEEIAGYINDHYIPVKVDREERPDVDAVYMSAVQAISGQGGWPMTVWLTPDHQPFYGGTYFPARDGDRGATVGFLTLLKKIRESYDHRRDLVVHSAGELSRVVGQMLAPAGGDRLPMDNILERAVASVRSRFDDVNGGVGGPPKFPSSLPVRLLLRHHRRTGDAKSLEMAIMTLEKMAAGGIHDQIGGGFHRYATDAGWLVPHFEKMLYDNALLVPAYIEGWQAAGKTRLRQVAVNTLEYVAREMTSPQGAFYSATDADSLTPAGRREEGYYFTWTLAELENVLSREDARVAAAVYGVRAEGNFEGRNVLFLPRGIDETAKSLGLSVEDLSVALDRINVKLYAHRQERPTPLCDDKILAAWNGLMISAFARGGMALEDPNYIQRAERAADFIWNRMVADRRLGRSYKDGTVSGNGFLEDYAFVIAALLDLCEATADLLWLDRAVALDRTLAERFADSENGGFFMTADDHEALIAREKPMLDGALPSGNAAAMMNLLRLHGLTLAPAYMERAEKGLRTFSTSIEARPGAFGEMLMALEYYLHPPCQAVVVVPAGKAPRRFVHRLRTAFLPGSLAMAVSEDQAAGLARRAPLFKGKTTVDGKVTAYVCRNGACRLPATSEAEMLAQL